MRNVTVPIAQCLGLARIEAIGAPVNLVLQRADGGLHVLAMDGPTALAMVAAIRVDISAPIEAQHQAMAAEIFDAEDFAHPVLAAAGHIHLLKIFDSLQKERARLQRTIRWALGLAILIAGITIIGIGLGRVA